MNWDAYCWRNEVYCVFKSPEGYYTVTKRENHGRLPESLAQAPDTSFYWAPWTPAGADIYRFKNFAELEAAIESLDEDN